MIPIDLMKELDLVVRLINNLSSLLTIEGQVMPDNRLISEANINKTNTNLEILNDYLISILPIIS